MPKRQRQDTHWLEQMQWYQATIANQWDLIWKPDVNTTADLPANWNEIWDTRLVRSSGYAYQYTSNWWKKIAGSWGWGWGTTTWWDIEWDIADQTDLKNALDDKASAGDVTQLSNDVDAVETALENKLDTSMYPQVITQVEYDALPATKATDGIIRFIYTVE